MSITPKGATVHIRKVSTDNLEQELQFIREIVDDYPCLTTTETRFQRLVMEPDGKFLNGRDAADYHYATMRGNADSMKLIQLGLEFSDEEGNLPSFGTMGNCVWQFNLTDVNPNQDFHEYAKELLQQSGIIDFGQRAHIREVWADNFEQEFQLMCEIMHDYPYLAITDRELLWSGRTPDGEFIDGRNIANYHYPTMRASADSVKLIQMKLRFSDGEGNLPTCGTTDNCTWRFNFRGFDLNGDLHEVYDAIGRLQRTATNSQANSKQGIDSQRFRELLMDSKYNAQTTSGDLHEVYDAIGRLQRTATNSQANSKQGIDSQRFRELLMDSKYNAQTTSESGYNSYTSTGSEYDADTSSHSTIDLNTSTDSEDDSDGSGYSTTDSSTSTDSEHDSPSSSYSDYVEYFHRV